MATTQFFEKTLTDKKDKSITLDIEFGRSSFYGGESLIYLSVNGTGLIMDEAQGREMFEAMQSLGAYLGYDK